MLKNFIGSVLWMLILVLTFGAIVGLVAWQREDLRFYSIHSDNLSSQVKTGDLIVVRNAVASGQPISFDDIAHKVVLEVPLAGYIFDFLRRPIAMIALIYLPASLIILAELKRLSGRYRHKPYRWVGYL